MAITSLDALIAAAQKGPTRVVSVAAAHERSVLEATVTARKKGIATPIYVGDSRKITEILRELGEDPAEYRMVAGGSDEDCAQKATELVARGEADFLMKGYLGTATLLRAVLKREGGLVTGKLMSHMMMFETPLYPKLLLMTDGGMIPDPDLQQKIGILTHAAELLKKLEYDKIYAACLTGAEVINPKIPSTVHADLMSKMDWSAYDMEVYGPVALDLAVSPFSCARKGYTAPGAGEADILLMANYEAGDALYKAAWAFAPECHGAGLIAGAKRPVVLVSRSDSVKSKLASVALGALVSE